MEWNPRKWSNDKAWRIHQAAVLGASALTLVGLGFALAGVVLSVQTHPNQGLLSSLWVIGWVLVFLGVLWFVLMWLTRHAEKPRPYRLRLHFPKEAKFGMPARGSTPAANALVLDDVWLINESDETLILEFQLHCGDVTLGMKPYRSFYRDHRSDIKDVYLSNPRHLGPRETAEAGLPFMSNDGYPDGGTCTRIDVLVNPPGGDRFSIPLPTSEAGFIAEGLIKPLALDTPALLYRDG